MVRARAEAAENDGEREKDRRGTVHGRVACPDHVTQKCPSRVHAVRQCRQFSDVALSTVGRSRSTDSFTREKIGRLRMALCNFHLALALVLQTDAHGRTLCVTLFLRQ